MVLCSLLCLVPMDAISAIASVSVCHLASGSLFSPRARVGIASTAGITSTATRLQGAQRTEEWPARDKISLLQEIILHG